MPSFGTSEPFYACKRYIIRHVYLQINFICYFRKPMISETTERVTIKFVKNIGDHIEGRKQINV